MKRVVSISLLLLFIASEYCMGVCVVDKTKVKEALLSFSTLAKGDLQLQKYEINMQLLLAENDLVREQENLWFYGVWSIECKSNSKLQFLYSKTYEGRTIHLVVDVTIVKGVYTVREWDILELDEVF